MSTLTASLPFRFERVLVPSLRARVLTPIVSIVLGLLTGGLLLLVTGENPIEVYRAIVDGALGSTYGLTETLVKMTPLLLTGLGVAVAFRMQLWNIGAEGQFYWGAIGATAVALSCQIIAWGWRSTTSRRPSPRTSSPRPRGDGGRGAAPPSPGAGTRSRERPRAGDNNRGKGYDLKTTT